MKPIDRTGQLRYGIREALNTDHPNGSRFDNEDLERILEALR